VGRIAKRLAPLGGAALLSLAIANTTASVAQGGCPNAGVGVDQLSSEQVRDAIVCVFNKKRGPDLRENDMLEVSAQTHTSVMRRKECFAHDCPGEPNLLQRIAKTGYLRGATNPGLAEVLKYAVDYITPQQMASEWMDGGPHAAIIKKRSYKDVGVGVSVKNGSILATAHLGHR
jgi:uncharacterized protein YkwD